MSGPFFNGLEIEELLRLVELQDQKLSAISSDYWTQEQEQELRELKRRLDEFQRS